MTRLFVPLLIAMTLFCGVMGAETIHLERLDIQDGLSQNTITCIIQDHFGFMWMGTKDGLNRYDGCSIKVFKRDQTSPDGLGDNYVKALCEDFLHNIWIGTDSGLYLYDRKTERISAFLLSDHDSFITPPCITGIEKDIDGNVWVVAGARIHRIDPAAGTSRLMHVSDEPSLRRMLVEEGGKIYFCGYDFCGIYHTDDGFKTVSMLKDRSGKMILEDDVVTCFLPVGDGRILVGSEKFGVTVVDPEKKEWQVLPLSENGENVFVRCILKYSDDEYWIGTEDGVIIYHSLSGEKQHLKKSYSNPHALADNAIYSLCKDSDGGIWIGTFFGGINYLHTRHEAISRYYPTQSETSIGGLRVCEICPDGKGHFWIGTEDAGLYRFNPSNGESVHVPQSDCFTNVHGLMVHGNELWICTFAEGLKVLDTISGGMREYRLGDRSDIQSDFVFSVCESSGTIYVGTAQGVLKYVRESDSFIPETPVYGGIFIRDMYSDPSGNLWAATMQRGVFRKDAGTGVWANWSNDPSDPATIPSNNITGIFEDSSSTMWFATEGKGICKMVGKRFISYNSSIGFPSDLACQITQDRQNNLWISTIGGLVCFDPEKESILHVYTISDGLLSNQFNYNSCLRDEDGRMWFGSIGGLISFDPQELSKQTLENTSPVFISELYVSDALVLPSVEGSPLTESILTADHITLKDNQRSISMRLVSPSYLSVSSDRILYRMDGVDDQWRTLSDATGMVYYPQLPAGHFVFKTMSVGTESVNEGGKTLTITVLRPALRSIGAMVGYALMLATLIFLFARYVAEGKKRNAQAERAVFEAAKEKELYDAKLNFFTSVAHEIRTPLSLIKGPLENILGGRSDESEIQENLQIMDRNANRLIDLIGELLDFNKVENRAITLDMKDCDVAAILRDTVLRFSSAARQKGLAMNVHTTCDGLHAELDEKNFIKVISNLLNNALKYSTSLIDVYLEPRQDSFRIIISNDGRPIAEEFREKIFEPFFRIDENGNVPGSGMGLPFARSIARMHDGDLTLDCEGETISFVLTLPYRHTGVGIVEPAVNEEDKDSYSRQELTILVVEDNPDMQSFIAGLFSRNYRTLKAGDGKEALELLEKNITDLVITDLMMPRMDGIELCNAIKSNRTFSHIPVIILSAKTSVEAKISGTRAGADIYVEKPFSPEYLTSVVTNLFENRESLMQRFLSGPLESFHSIASSEVESELLEKIRSLIRANLTNPDFNIDDIASNLAMSRATFYRKIKGILGMSPNDYLKLERLKAAAQLLSDHKYNINEITYMVGFNSPSYFSKCFQKQFGISPKDFMKS